ncbi:hypothetical protein MKW98_005014 [Papaver atlanticum]|uniref:Trichome birefringence-like N-terminal domain-containing protein n=1 Tax=Papaver atlanticum TaxID=357466 RepID=A0AAD4THE5_9MAGN|nr:hypothetical protein MKW98_005014 [Papaver atlanticum]
MVKYSRLDEKPSWFMFKQYNDSLVKITVSILVLGFGFCLLYSASTSSDGNSIGDVSISSPFVDKTVDGYGDGASDDLPTTTSNDDSVEIQKEKCDLAIGEWIPDPLGPMYTNESCNVITDNQNCMMNGRPDTGFLYWRWKPRDCELPRFDAVRFLDSMRNKHWGFIGDSISRNHVQSVLCILSKVEAANEVYHDKDYRNRRWHFPTYNFTLTIIWSPFLVKAYNYEYVNGVEADPRIHLDELDNVWTDQYTSFDYIVMSGGKWFLRSAVYQENNTIVGCHYCPGKKNVTEYGLENAYRKAMKLVLDFILNSNHNASVFYRATTSEHFENGSWDTGGTCDRTKPFKEGEISLNYMDVAFRDIELEAFENLKNVGSTGKKKFLKLLDVTILSLLRPDGHPGPYRYFQPFAKDKNATVQYDYVRSVILHSVDKLPELCGLVVQISSLLMCPKEMQDAICAVKEKTVEDAEVPPPPAPSVHKTAEDAISQPPAPSEDPAKLQQNKTQNQIPRNVTCDLSIGEWIPDPSGPMYNNESCSFITEDQNCIKNGRPDLGFLYWRWKPRDCELPRFNAVKFLDSMRNKHWAFVGDSISRNHVQSLLCILSKVEAANEVFHEEGFKNRRWHLPSYNFSLTVMWSPFLVKANSEDLNDIRLDLDKLDKKWADQYTSFDYMVMSGGKWFLRAATYYENNTIVGCHYCPGKNLTEYGLDNGYRKALKLVTDFVLNSNHSGIVLYRTTTPDHFENGYWNTGGTCDRTAPYKEGETHLNDLEVIFNNVELEAFKDLEATGYSGKRKNLKLFNITELSLLRPDGHPGAYRRFHPLAKDKNTTEPNDCLHWCLPGPIDNWNDLVMEMVLSG